MFNHKNIINHYIEYCKKLDEGEFRKESIHGFVNSGELTQILFRKEDGRVTVTMQYFADDVT